MHIFFSISAIQQAFLFQKHLSLFYFHSLLHSLTQMKMKRLTVKSQL